MAATFSRGSRLRARGYDLLCALTERQGLGEWRARLVGGLDGSVLEIGAGTGLNLGLYPAGASVVALDRDPVMLERAVTRADDASASVQVMVGDAMGRLPFADGSVDNVVSCLVMCSIPRQQEGLAEVARVLRPGGRYRFIEHVRDVDGTLRARAQDVFNPLWRRLSGGCNCDRDTAHRIAGAGFDIVEIHRFMLGRSHVAPHVMGEAVLR